MNRTIPLLAGVLVLGMGMAFGVRGDYGVANEGQWPASWPKELEPLRKQARTLEGPMVLFLQYEIPFTKREEFEAAWPAILKVKTSGAPVILLRAPNSRLGGTIEAGVRIHCPPRDVDRKAHPEAPIPSNSIRERWMWTNYIELVVDGKIVDLNRIKLPADTPIVDERFEGGTKTQG